MIIRTDTATGLSFMLADGHEPPIWPAGPGDQQLQTHLAVDGLTSAVARADQIDAVPASCQAQELVRVMLGPTGHQCCLFAPGG